MPKDETEASTAATGAAIDDSPEISRSRTKSFSNPLKSFKERRRASKASAATAAAVAAATAQPSETDAADRTPLVFRTDQQSVAATSSHEQDTFISMMRATRGMTPEEVKAFLERKAVADHERHKNDVGYGRLYMGNSSLGLL